MPRRKWTPEIQSRMVEAFSRGMKVSLACKYAGIDVTNHYMWIRRGRHGTYPFAGYRRAVELAVAGHAMELLAVADAEARTSWSAAAWMMERVHGYTKDAPPEGDPHQTGTHTADDLVSLLQRVARARPQLLVDALSQGGPDDDDDDRV